MRSPCTRRQLLGAALGFGAASAFLQGCRTTSDAAAGRIMTVLGPIAPRRLGTTLPHEHVVVDFIGADRAGAQRYEGDQAFALALAALADFRAAGGSALVECTPAYIGRNVALLARLSAASGTHILTNTGYYGAVNNKYLPPHAFTESADQLAARWLTEWREGIDGTAVRPGFVKLGVGDGRLPELHAKLVRAGARVHRQTGLTVAIHTGNGEAARDELRILREEGVAPAALIWVHAQNDPGPVQVELARAGAWVSLDGFSPAPGHLERYVGFLGQLRSERLLHRALISHDDGWAVEGDGPRATGLKLFANGNTTPYASIFSHLLPGLDAAGFTKPEIQQLMVLNPREAFTIRPRLLP